MASFDTLTSILAVPLGLALLAAGGSKLAGARMAVGAWQVVAAMLATA